MTDIAREALDLAKEAKRDIEAHEDICAVRYEGIRVEMAEMKSIIKWAGSLLITLILAVLGWSLVQQFNANEAQKQKLEEQIKLLQATGNSPTTP